MHKITIILAILLSAGGFVACGEAYMPKPYGYFRVDLPAHAYRPLGDTLGLPYTFDLSKYALVLESKEREEDGKINPLWIDIAYPTLNATVFCSYKPVKNNLLELSEEAYKIVHKHDVRADDIDEKLYEHPEYGVFGLLYDLGGNTASNLQLTLTDSTHHFFRAAIYFNNVPNKDSIAPMVDFVRQDMIQLMEIFRWTR
ncbi:MAG: gliding motility lipoprotein GldD [Prevotellaceae bacterium]|jgi:gliding motility-associated lipoprotein GldD|nr:gliding motility lipoprotein GldD [Prevotellaceae bacterium]